MVVCKGLATSGSGQSSPRFYNRGFACSRPNRSTELCIVTFIAENWPLIMLACVSGGMLLAQSLRANSGVHTTEAVRLINREKGVLVDVSEAADFAKERPAGARNVPVDQLGSTKELPSNKALPLILVCADGARSARAVAAFKQAGHANVVALRGGTRAWREANMPLDKSTDKPADPPASTPKKPNVKA
jgi:rhodanese-related sulfurtransferase